MKKIILLTVIMALISSTIMNAQTNPQAAKETKVLIKTSLGDITVKLYNDTPKHRDNFIKMVKEGWYDGSTFHRVIKSFMIQGGGNKDGRQDPGYTIDAEIKANHFHKRGALAAARMSDDMNPQKKSSGCQFYIVQGNKYTNENMDNFEKRYGVKYTKEQRDAYTTIGGTPHLDGNYTVFGEVVAGMDVVDKIATVKTGQGDKPETPVTMSMKIIQ